MASFNKSYEGPIIQDNITIIDIDAESLNKGVQYIELPFVPKELSWTPESNFVPIKAVGRNNPKYHYTGSEDKIEFEIDWHSFDENRADVITKCRLIESLSKGDGYNNPPHRVLLNWGYNNILFRDMIFIVIAAPYRLTQFSKSQYNNQNIINDSMMPIQAYQKVTLARITSNNLTYKDIQLVNNF